MEQLPDLAELNITEKDALIRTLFAQVQVLTAQAQVLTAKVAELEGRLVQNSRNSSKSPSSDGLKKSKPKSLRIPGQHPSGGQLGHAGHTLKKVPNPDRVAAHLPPSECAVCHRPLDQATVVEVRQVFDLPPLRVDVTEHRVLKTRCTCGKFYRGAFPADVSAPVQYGPAALAAAVHLPHHHMMPVQRTASLMDDFFALPMGDATVSRGSINSHSWATCKTSAHGPIT